MKEMMIFGGYSELGKAVPFSPLPLAQSPILSRCFFYFDFLHVSVESLRWIKMGRRARLVSLASAVIYERLAGDWRWVHSTL